MLVAVGIGPLLVATFVITCICLALALIHDVLMLYSNNHTGRKFRIRLQFNSGTWKAILVFSICSASQILVLEMSMQLCSFQLTYYFTSHFITPSSTWTICTQRGSKILSRPAKPGKYMKATCKFLKKSETYNWQACFLRQSIWANQPSLTTHLGTVWAALLWLLTTTRSVQMPPCKNKPESTKTKICAGFPMQASANASPIHLK